MTLNTHDTRSAVRAKPAQNSGIDFCEINPKSKLLSPAEAVGSDAEEQLKTRSSFQPATKKKRRLKRQIKLRFCTDQNSIKNDASTANKSNSKNCLLSVKTPSNRRSRAATMRFAFVWLLLCATVLSFARSSFGGEFAALQCKRNCELPNITVAAGETLPRRTRHRRATASPSQQADEDAVAAMQHSTQAQRRFAKKLPANVTQEEHNSTTNCHKLFQVWLRINAAFPALAASLIAASSARGELFRGVARVNPRAAQSLLDAEKALRQESNNQIDSGLIASSDSNPDATSKPPDNYKGSDFASFFPDALAKSNRARQSAARLQSSPAFARLIGKLQQRLATDNPHFATNSQQLRGESELSNELVSESHDKHDAAEFGRVAFFPSQLGDKAGNLRVLSKLRALSRAELEQRQHANKPETSTLSPRIAAFSSQASGSIDLEPLSADPQSRLDFVYGTQISPAQLSGSSYSLGASTDSDDEVSRLDSRKHRLRLATGSLRAPARPAPEVGAKEQLFGSVVSRPAQLLQPSKQSRSTNSDYFPNNFWRGESANSFQ